MWRTRRPRFKTDDELFAVFTLAEKLGMTVHKLLTGETKELSTWEFNHWMSYFEYKAKLEEKASKKK